jgi:hypothetical protein
MEIIRIELIWYKNNTEIVVAVMKQDSNREYISAIQMD